MKNQMLTIGAALTLTLISFAPANAYTVRLEPLSGATSAKDAQKPSVSDATLIARCAAPDVDAIGNEEFMQIPTIAREQNAGGTSEIQIALSQSGTLQHASLLTSSGNPNLDRAALQSAHMGRYAPEIKGCAAVAGTYRYVVQF